MITKQEKEKNLNEWFELTGKLCENSCKRILEEVEIQRKLGKTIYPAQEDILNALNLVSPKEVKTVILGQDPYHEPNQAMGLAFSVPDEEPIPRSLNNIYKELNNDIGCSVPNSGNLTRWAEQGVLLLNTVLTVEAHKANSHKNLGWQAFTSSILSVTVKLNQPIVFICWGTQAEKTLKDVLDKSWGNSAYHHVIRSTHPSPLSASKSTKLYPAFLGSKPFSKANAWLKSHGAKPIVW